MLRYLGGTFENVWHSHPTPATRRSSRASVKLVGLGLLEGRAYKSDNRRPAVIDALPDRAQAFDWSAGLVAVLRILGLCLLRTRQVLRNDLAGRAG